MNQKPENTRTSPEQLNKPPKGVCKCGGETEPYFLMERWFSPDECPACEEKRNNILKVQQQQEAKEQKEHWTRQRFEESGLCPINKTMTFETFKVNDKNRNVHTYIKNMKELESLFITGKCGHGKSHLASAIAMSIFDTGHRVRFLTVPNLLLEIRDTFKKDTEKSEMDIVSSYLDCKYLFLDDFGAEKISEWTLETIYVLIDTRIRNMRPTIITSNLSLPEVEDRFNDRIASRIAGNFKILELNDYDHRLKREIK